jgi:hypothetical protein
VSELESELDVSYGKLEALQHQQKTQQDKTIAVVTRLQVTGLPSLL